MATREMKQNIASGVAFAVLPMLLLLKTSTTMLGGPTSASATIQPTFVINPPVGEALRVSWTEQQKTAAAHIEFLKDQPFDSSPLHRAVVSIPTDEGPKVAAADMPSVTVQMIMSSATETVALIDGHRCVVGDTLPKTSWVIVEVDALAVTFKHTRTGQTAVISVQTP